MLDIQTSPNSIYISTVETGCCKAKFDSTYSSRSSIPCSWKLESTKYFVSEYQNNNTVQLSLFQLVIDIGRSATLGNEVYYSNEITHESISFVGRRDNYAPPLYSGQSAEFCSSCGQLFNKY